MNSIRNEFERLESEYSKAKLAICEVLFSKHISNEQSRIRKLSEEIADMAMIKGELARLCATETADNQDTPVPAPTTPTRSDTAY